MRRLSMFIGLLLVMAVPTALLGCGGEQPSAPVTDEVANDGNPEGPDAKQTGASVEVEMINTSFEPAAVEVSVGDTVEWTNEDDFDHNATAEEGADFASGDFGYDETFEWKATEPGEISYTCTLHPGMDGTINVVE